MDRRQRWLGYLAIGLGLLALITALPRPGWGHRIRIEGPAVSMPAPEAPPVAEAPRGFYRHEGPGFWGGPPMHHGWHGGPGFLLDNLVKLAMLFVLTALGLRLLRGPGGPWGPPGRHAGPRWQHGGPPPPWQEVPPPPPAPPSDPPHTGPTTRL